MLKDQVLSINLEPNDNQKPIVEITQPATVFVNYFKIKFH